jgi:hypothetical protein
MATSFRKMRTDTVVHPYEYVRFTFRLRSMFFESHLMYYHQESRKRFIFLFRNKLFFCSDFFIEIESSWASN